MGVLSEDKLRQLLQSESANRFLEQDFTLPTSTIFATRSVEAGQ